MKLAVAILLVCVAIPQAFGFFEIPSFGKEFERVKKAGKEIIEGAGRHMESFHHEVQKQRESVQQTIQEKGEAWRETIKHHTEALQQTLPNATEVFTESNEKLNELWKEMYENVARHQGKWEEGKQHVKKMWREMTDRANEHKEKLKKKWEDKEGSWQEFKQMWKMFIQKLNSLEKRMEGESSVNISLMLEKIEKRSKALIRTFKETLNEKIQQVRNKLERKLTTEEEEVDETTSSPEIFTEEPYETGVPEIPEDLETTTFPTEHSTESSGSEEVMGGKTEESSETGQPEVPEDDGEGDDDDDDDDDEPETDEVPLPEKEDEEEPMAEDDEDDNEGGDNEEEDGGDTEGDVAKVVNRARETVRKRKQNLLSIFSNQKRRLMTRKILGKWKKNQGRQNAEVDDES